MERKNAYLVRPRRDLRRHVSSTRREPDDHDSLPLISFGLPVINGMEDLPFPLLSPVKPLLDAIPLGNVRVVVMPVRDDEVVICPVARELTVLCPDCYSPLGFRVGGVGDGVVCVDVGEAVEGRGEAAVVFVDVGVGGVERRPRQEGEVWVGHWKNSDQQL